MMIIMAKRENTIIEQKKGFKNEKNIRERELLQITWFKNNKRNELAYCPIVWKQHDDIISNYIVLHDRK